MGFNEDVTAARSLQEARVRANVPESTEAFDAGWIVVEETMSCDCDGALDHRVVMVPPLSLETFKRLHYGIQS